MLENDEYYTKKEVSADLVKPEVNKRIASDIGHGQDVADEEQCRGVLRL